MRLFVPVFKMFSGDDGAVWWRMFSACGRGLARSATPEPSLEAARAAIIHVVDCVDLFSPSLRRTESFRWQWVLSLDHEPAVWGVGDFDRLDRGERACRRFTLLAPLADVDPGSFRVGPAPGRAAHRTAAHPAAWPAAH